MAAPTPTKLLDALRAAGNPVEASMLEHRLFQLWIASISPAARLLIERGQREMQGGDAKNALEEFDGLVALEPAQAEAWRQRAQARLEAGDLDGAARDGMQSLALDAQHFPALAVLSRVAEQRGDWKNAYAAWSRLMAIDPQTEGGARRLEELRKKAFGQET